MIEESERMKIARARPRGKAMLKSSELEATALVARCAAWRTALMSSASSDETLRCLPMRCPTHEQVLCTAVSLYTLGLSC